MRSRLIKALNNRFYVKFMQLEIGLLVCAESSANFEFDGVDKKCVYTRITFSYEGTEGKTSEWSIFAGKPPLINHIRTGLFESL